MILKIFILICIFFILIKYLNCKTTKEHYITYTNDINFLKSEPKKIKSLNNNTLTIQLSENMVNPLFFYFKKDFEGEGKLVNQIFFKNKLKKIFPFHNKYYNIPWQQILCILNSKKNIVSLIPEDAFTDSYLGLKYYNNKKKNKNLRYICSVYYSHFTLIAPINSNIKNWTHLQNKKIGTIKHSFSFYNLKRILSICNYKNNSVQIILVDTIDDLIQKFSERKFDSIYLSTSHPNIKLINLSLQMKLYFIFTEGINVSKFKFNFPWCFKQKVQLKYYNTYPSNTPLINSYATRVILCTNNNTDENKIYNLVKAIFNNINYFQFETPFLNDLLPNFMIFLLPMIKYHKGALKYFKDLGYITNNSNPFCALFAGTGKCTENKLKKNNFLEFNNTPLNYLNKYIIPETTEFQNFYPEKIQTQEIFQKYKGDLKQYPNQVFPIL
jgi:TRAP-type uncharacterized transport system substrate-binding protein